MIWRMRLYGAIPSGVLLRRDIRPGLLRCESLDELIFPFVAAMRERQLSINSIGDSLFARISRRASTAERSAGSLIVGLTAPERFVDLILVKGAGTQRLRRCLCPFNANQRFHMLS
jgi:hypothetical protein